MRQLRFQIRTFKGFPCLIRNLVSHSNTRHTRQYWMTIFDGLSHVVFKTIALRCTRIHQYSTLRLATDIAVFKYICGTIATGVFGRGNNAFGASCRLKQSLFRTVYSVPQVSQLCSNLQVSMHAPSYALSLSVKTSMFPPTSNHTTRRKPRIQCPTLVFMYQTYIQKEWPRYSISSKTTLS